MQFSSLGRQDGTRRPYFLLQKRKESTKKGKEELANSTQEQVVCKSIPR